MALMGFVLMVLRPCSIITMEWVCNLIYYRHNQRCDVVVLLAHYNQVWGLVIETAMTVIDGLIFIFSSHF